MAQVFYTPKSDTVTIKLDTSEAVWFDRLVTQASITPFRDLVNDWIRIKATELARKDLSAIKARLDSASAVEIATVMVALRMNGDPQAAPQAPQGR